MHEAHSFLMSKKEVRINARASEQTVHDLKIAARLRGLTVSSLVNLLVVKTIREEKAIAPEAFGQSPNIFRKESHTESRDRTSESQDWSESLRNARGIWKDRDDLPDFDELRKEWSRDVWKEQK